MHTEKRADRYEYLLLAVSLQDKNVVKAELHDGTAVDKERSYVTIQKIHKCVPILLRTRN